MFVLCNSTGESGIRAAGDCLRSGGSALDAVENGIRLVESNPEVHSVGRGGWPNMIGEMELDASIMDGNSLRTGAVGALRGYLHPISIARLIMDRLPHVMLVGDGAARFAAECNAETDDNLTPDTREGWRRWLEEHIDPAILSRWPDVSLARYTYLTMDPALAKGTTVFIARDAEANLAAGVSTSGWAWKYPGRLGDSPIIGAGNYVDNRYGAAACTGRGELTVRTATARSVVLYLKIGMSVEEACREAARDFEQLDREYRYCVTIFAADRHGRHFVLASGSCDGDRCWRWSEGMPAPENLPPDAHV